MINSQKNNSHLLNELGNGHVHIKDPDCVENIINRFVQDGLDKLQVISDFDMTLSRFRDWEGNKCDSCYHAIDSSDSIPQFYKDEAEKLKGYYYPIEIDPNRSIEEKTPFMVEWWSKAHDLMAGCNIRKEMIPKFVKESKIYFRDGSDWLLQQLDACRVPLLVFSAGIGDIIEEVFRQRSKMYSNIKIVSNFMHFNREGVMDGFVGELMHVFNKNENVIHKSDYFESICNRSNILLMGDSLGDLRMAEGANCDKILKIGFLNDKIEENLQKYIDSFDIVIVNDQTMEVPNSIVKKICQPKGTNPNGII